MAALRVKLGPSMEEKKIHIFPKIHTTLVLLLSVITLWLYTAWWFYSRALKLNQKSSRPFKMWLVVVYGVLSILVITFDYLPFNMPNTLGMALMLAYIFAYLVIVFDMKSEIEGVIHSSGIKGFHLTPILAFLLGPIYFQYKINSAYAQIENENT
ncbi:MAG: hypothetical protein K6L81_13000 [Agarilytica sp.]